MMKQCSVIVAAMLMTSCAMFDSAYQGATGLTDPDSLKLQGYVEWLNPQPDLRLSDDMTLYLRIRNSSGSDFPINTLRTQAAAEMQAAGYQLVQQPNQAQYVMRVNVRGYGENAAKASSSAVGAAIGGLIGYGVSSNDEYKTAAGVGGAVLGEMVTNVMRNRNKQVRIDLVADVIVGERVAGGVTTTRTTGGNQQLRNANQHASKLYNAGSSNTQSTETQVVKTTEDFLNHENRLIASAERLKLTPPEAIDYLLAKMVGAVSGVLP